MSISLKAWRFISLLIIVGSIFVLYKMGGFKPFHSKESSDGAVFLVGKMMKDSIFVRNLNFEEMMTLLKNKGFFCEKTFILFEKDPPFTFKQDLSSLYGCVLNEAEWTRANSFKELVPEDFLLKVIPGQNVLTGSFAGNQLVGDFKAFWAAKKIKTMEYSVYPLLKIYEDNQGNKTTHYYFSLKID